MRAVPALSSLTLVALLAAAGLARAEEEKSCRQQIEELCPNSSPNTPERRQCVQQGIEKLSASCQQQLGHVKAMAVPAPAAGPGAGGLQDLVKACSKDHPRMVELCQTARKPGENPLPCLSEHASEFSESCQRWIHDAEAATAAGVAKPGAAKAPAGSGPAKPPTAAK